MTETSSASLFLFKSFQIRISYLFRLLVFEFRI
jgi:hypothetical protein